MIIVFYNLSEACRRSELAAGRSAEKERTIEAIPSEILAKLAKLENERGVIDVRRCWFSENGQRNCGSNYASVDCESDRILTADSAEQYVLECEAKFLAETTQLVAKYEQKQHENAERQAKSATEEAERKERRAREQAETEARLAPFQVACRDYVIAHVPEFARAAKEGHDVTAIAQREICSRLTSTLQKRFEDFNGQCFPLIECYGSEDRDCPSADAYRVFDAVNAVNVLDPPIVAEKSVRIVRADVAAAGRAVWRTAVELRVKWGNGESSEWYVLVDPEGLPDESEDDDA